MRTSLSYWPSVLLGCKSKTEFATCVPPFSTKCFVHQNAWEIAFDRAQRKASMRQQDKKRHEQMRHQDMSPDQLRAAVMCDHESGMPMGSRVRAVNTKHLLHIGASEEHASFKLSRFLYHRNTPRHMMIQNRWLAKKMNSCSIS